MATEKKMVASDITPYGSFILITFASRDEEVTDGGIIIPETEAPTFKIQDAEVLRIGDTVKEDGVINEGDKVLVPTDTIGIDLKDRMETLREGAEFRIVAVENIIAVITCK